MDENKMVNGQPEQPLSPNEEMEQLFDGLRADSEALLARSSELADTTEAQFDAVVNEAGEITGLLDAAEAAEPAEPAEAALPEAADTALPEAEGAENTAAPKQKKKGGNTLKGLLASMKKGVKTKKTAAKPAAEGEEKSGGKKAKKSAGKRTGWQKFWRFCIVCCCIGIMAACALGVAAVMYLVDATADDNKILNIDQIKLSFATRLMAYDDETGEWYEYERLYSGENRIWVEYGDMPQHLIDAIVSSEDKRFYDHHGVDWRRTFFSFFNEYIYKTRDTQGGSTLTQQLIKNVTDEKAVSGFDGALRKLREIYRALEMEKNYSKEQILEAYLNTFRLSGQVAGIESAANYYFGKTTQELSVAECAAIVVITKAPSAYNPYNNPEDNKVQRDYVLSQMKLNGYLTEQEYNAAKAESDAMVFDEANKTTSSSSSVYSYFTDAVIDQVLDDFVNIKGMTLSEANDMLFQGGLTIYLTMDPDIQAKVEEVSMDTDIWPDLKYEEDGVTPKENQIQAAMVVMDYKGQVLGVAGGIREKSGSRSLNRATEAKRQTGSAMKPIAAYAPGIELNKIHFSSLMSDSACDVINGKPWPQNFSDNYGTPLTVYKALALSLNTVAVHTLNLVGEDFAFDFLTTSLGFTNLVDSRWSEAQGKYLTDRTRSLALGALTDGVTVLEMTAAYAIFGNGGVYTTPHFYTHIEDSSGDVYLDKTKYLTTSEAISAETAEIMNRMMRGVLTEGTGTRARHGKLPLAGKSGTTSDNNDFWFIGLNPYYVMGVWMGYDLNGSMPYSIHYDTQDAFKAVMSAISKDLEYKNFPSTGRLTVAEFCMSSGDLATPACPNTRTGYYKSSNVPGYCDHGYYTNDGEGA